MMLRQPLRHLHRFVKVQRQSAKQVDLLTTRVKHDAEAREIICRAANTGSSSSEMSPLETSEQSQSSGRGRTFWTIVATMVPVVGGKSCCLSDKMS